MVLTGKCEEMCSKAEINLRHKEGLLHILEMKKGTEKNSRPLPDPRRVVKSFSRSAAGRESNESELRTPNALQRTVNYLLHDVADNQIISWNRTYDFIFDRLLAVRQDIVIQDVSRSYTISMLQPIVKFYAYSAYRLCESPISDFDPVLNKQNLQECLKKLLLIYDDFDLLQLKIEMLNDFSYNQEDFEILFKDCRQFYEALYILFNLGDSHCIYRGLKLNKKWRTNLVKNSLRMSLCYKNGNWIRLCGMMVKLPPLLAGIASLHLPEIRRKTLEKMSVAFSSKNLWYPLEVLQKELIYGNKNELISDCDRYGIKHYEDKLIFVKTDFDKFSKLVCTKKEKFVIEKFVDVKPSFVLNSNTF